MGQEKTRLIEVLKGLPDLIGKHKRFLKLTRAEEIARRYFVMNSFDGALTVLGIILGSYVAGVREPTIILSAVLGASLAMGLSGVWGAYTAEKAERTRELKELEAALFTNLKGTRLHKASLATIVWLAVIDGVSPVVVALTAISPFLLCLLGLLSFTFSLYASITITILVLFILGVFLGKISRENLILNGLKMVSAGALIAIILLTFKLLL
ncbi:MAG: VIT1/CCC1 transporter family protein [Candidatus Hecatellaceae archaeon]